VRYLSGLSFDFPGDGNQITTISCRVACGVMTLRSQRPRTRVSMAFRRTPVAKDVGQCTNGRFEALQSRLAPALGGRTLAERPPAACGTGFSAITSFTGYDRVGASVQPEGRPRRWRRPHQIGIRRIGHIVRYAEDIDWSPFQDAWRDRGPGPRSFSLLDRGIHGNVAVHDHLTGVNQVRYQGQEY
jgi:hypothetical protein